ncbi:MAG: peptidyl-prolyl cis-trans isomerase [Proteobacteria bacterium]|jgi:parvulin-like peptidyl-prolyl isomerase|nr:peptidyl-prolyl cis-trans isomerase [Pseudomonadota bacterium]
MKLKHILCQHKFEAEDVMKALQTGKTFEELAKKFSHCSSAKVGGDLGDLSRKKHLLAPDFLEAAELLQPGQMSPIVRSSFGYHLIVRYE